MSSAGWSKTSAKVGRFSRRWACCSSPAWRPPTGRSRTAILPSPRFSVDSAPSALQAGGNMEGKEVRFGPALSALWATVTTDTSCGAVNSMHDSYLPIGGMVPMVNMQLGEVIFGGVGSGLYGILAFAIVAMFVAGLMVGRTPEYLGKKLEAKEVKMTMLALLCLPLSILGWTALATVVPAGPRRHRQYRAARLQRDPLRLHRRHRQQRQCLWRALGQHALLQYDDRFRDADRAVHHGHPATWRSQDHWRRRNFLRRRPAPSRPTGRCSWVCWWGSC